MPRRESPPLIRSAIFGLHRVELAYEPGHAWTVGVGQVQVEAFHSYYVTAITPTWATASR